MNTKRKNEVKSRNQQERCGQNFHKEKKLKINQNPINMIY